jgi:hypothetical protein
MPCLLGISAASQSGEMLGEDRLAEGEELGSNILQVGPRNRAGQSGRHQERQSLRAAPYRRQVLAGDAHRQALWHQLFFLR